MKNAIPVSLLLFIFIMVVSCGGGVGKKGSVGEKKSGFELPTPPLHLTSPAAQAEYIAEHYWDKFDFSDTAARSTTGAEQAFADYINILAYSGKNVSEKSISSMMDRASRDTAAFSYFTELYEKYLYDPNSPMRNEEIYIVVLNYLIGSDKLSGEDKTRFRHQLGKAMKNRPGDIAADLLYVQPSGVKGRMKDIRADYLIVMFYNPGCHACGEIQQAILNSPVINKMTGGEPGVPALRILAFYPDKDLAEWLKYLPDMPGSWIVGRDGTGNAGDIYDLRAIPNLYLLDGDKRVILKDATVERLEQALIQILQASQPAQ